MSVSILPLDSSFYTLIWQSVLKFFLKNTNINRDIEELFWNISTFCVVNLLSNPKTSHISAGHHVTSEVLQLFLITAFSPISSTMSNLCAYQENSALLNSLPFQSTPLTRPLNSLAFFHTHHMYPFQYSTFCFRILGWPLSITRENCISMMVGAVLNLCFLSFGHLRLFGRPLISMWLAQFLTAHWGCCKLPLNFSRPFSTCGTSFE